MNAHTGIGDIFERSKRIGDRMLSVADLVCVFDQLAWRPPIEERRTSQRPTAAELAAHPINWGGDYRVRSLKSAETNLRRAHAQFKKGWLTRKEFDHIERKCLEVIKGLK